MGHSWASFLSLLIAGGLKHPDPHPAEESLTGNSSSPSNTVQAWHRESYTHWYLWNVMLFPPQHLCGPLPARHFAASQLPRAGDGVSSAIFTLLSHPWDAAPTGKPRSSAQGLEVLLFKEPPPCPPQESLDWAKSPIQEVTGYGIILGRAV